MKEPTSSAPQKRDSGAWFKPLFWAEAFVERSFGGIRPLRIVHLLARKAYGKSKPDSAQFRIRRDRYSKKLWLQPCFCIDYQIIAFGIYDESVHHLLRQLVKPGAVCIRAGANVGSVTVRLMQLVGEQDRVYSV